MERLGPGVIAGAGFRATVTAAAGVCVAVLLAGCSVTVQPKHPVAAATPSQPASSTPSSTASPTPTPVKTTAAKDVDHTVCAAVRADLLSAQQKVGGADKNDARKMGADFKAAGTALKSQSQK